MTNWNYRKYESDQEDRRRAKLGRTPNRRGDYLSDNHGVLKDKWKKDHRKQLWRKKWVYIDSPDARHSFKTGARHPLGHSVGWRNRRDYAQRKEAKQVGFQHAIEHEPPKVPGRILRDAQEEALWLEESNA